MRREYERVGAPSRIPIEDAGLSEVLIRVAYRVVQIDVRKHPHQYGHNPTYGLRGLAAYMDEQGWGAIAGFVRNMDQACRLGLIAREHKDAVIRASRYAERERRWHG